MVVGMTIVARIDGGLPLAETLERVVGVVADLQPLLPTARDNAASVNKMTASRAIDGHSLSLSLSLSTNSPREIRLPAT